VQVDHIHTVVGDLACGSHLGDLIGRRTVGQTTDEHVDGADGDPPDLARLRTGHTGVDDRFQGIEPRVAGPHLEIEVLKALVAELRQPAR
jgi:hypothetical protein